MFLLNIKGETAKTSLARIGCPYISDLTGRIFKDFVSTPNNTPLIMWGRHNIFEDLSTWALDIRTTNMCERHFCCLTLY